jgi:phytoene desaturase
VSIIGAGFSGISAAAYLARQGYKVDVFEKNAEAGGRARQFATPEGFVFDMGPSWYWMPGVFEKFFNDFGYRSSDFYQLQLLDPSFEMVFGNNETLVIPADFNELCKLFDSIETGGAAKLKRFMSEGELKYRLGMEDLVYKPSLSITEYFTSSIIKNSLRVDLFLSFSRHVRKYFSDPRLIALMEFPVLFLGARPHKFLHFIA